ncbi:MAG TPA: efflux RND transporter periplasmic adaptor subunit [Bacteroidales bacterium]
MKSKNFPIRMTSFLLVIPLFIFSCAEKEVKVAPAPEIPVVEVIQKDVPIESDFTGQTYGYKDIPIRARVDGFLTGMYFQEGSEVKEGQLLYTIDPEPLKAQEATQLSVLAEAQAQLTNAESELNRYRPLAEINAVSKSDLDAAEATYKASLAAVEAARSQVKFAQINLGYTRISSPIHGIIGKTEAKVGEYVGAYPNPIVLNTVSMIDSILVQFSISEVEALRIGRLYSSKKSDTLQNKRDNSLRIRMLLSDGSIYEYPGRFDFANRQIDPSTGTILLQVSFPNEDKLLRPGQFARLKIVLDKVESGIIIPQRCVKEIQGVYQVYAVSDSNTVVVKDVKLGPKVGSMWLVESGLDPDETIIYEGLMLVKPGQKITPKITEVPKEFMNF